MSATIRFNETDVVNISINPLLILEAGVKIGTMKTKNGDGDEVTYNIQLVSSEPDEPIG